MSDDEDVAMAEVTPIVPPVVRVDARQIGMSLANEIKRELDRQKPQSNVHGDNHLTIHVHLGEGKPGWLSRLFGGKA